MGFPPDVAESALLGCGRCCCICHKFCGTKMELHHIVQKQEGGWRVWFNEGRPSYEDEIKQGSPVKAVEVEYAEKAGSDAWNEKRWEQSDKDPYPHAKYGR